MNNLDSALVEMAALAAEWLTDDDPGRTMVADFARQECAQALYDLRTRLAGGGDDGRDAVVDDAAVARFEAAVEGHVEWEGSGFTSEVITIGLTAALNSQQAVKP